MQFGSLFKKNFLLWRRFILSSLCEILLPLLLTLMVFGLSTLAVETEISNEDSLPIIIPTNEKMASEFGSSMKQYFKDCSSEYRKGGRVAIYPNNSFTQKLKKLFDFMTFETIYYDSKEEIDDTIDLSDYTTPFENDTWRQYCLSIEFDSLDSRNYEYNLRFNTTGPWTVEDHWDTVEKNPFIPFKKDDHTSFQVAMTNGVFLLKNYIDNLILEEETNKQIVVGLTRFKTEPYTSSNLYDILATPMSIIFLFLLIFPFIRIVGRVVGERENLILQNMENMGMKKYVYFWSTILFDFTKSFVIVLLISLVLKLGILKSVGFFIIFIPLLLACWVFIALGFFLSCFFVVGKKAIISSIVIFFALYLGVSLLTSISENGSAVILLSIFSPIVSIEIVKDAIIRAASNKSDFDFSNVDSFSFNVRIYSVIIILFIELIIYLLLGLYCFYVVPLSIGQYEHPLFFLKKKKNNKIKNKSKSDEENQMEMEKEYFEEISEEMKAQSENNKTLKIENLKKVFGNKKVAVNNLNLEMFSDQIFSLLGHNGAGKTTTVSMISGLLTQTSGTISLFGRNSFENRDFMKSKIGVCPQKNPLYDFMTVKEHLELYSKIKYHNDKSLKYDPKKEQEEIKTLLQDIELWDKRDNISKELSGGQKRKLCVCMAFIQGSEVILLDEPTSGMDTFARRHLWEMMKVYKKGRIIILTTHNMDEADYLGDRIGIMSSGRQVTCGSSMFLKNKFGVGYILNIIKEDQSRGQEIENKVKEYLPQAYSLSNYGLEMKIQLPKEESEELKNLFEFLEENGKTIGVTEFGISLTTLEDVFLKVGNLFDEEAMELKMKNQQLNQNGEPLIQSQNKIDDLYASERENNNKNKTINKNIKPDLLEDLEKGSLVDIRLKSKGAIWLKQIGALMKKRLLYFSRDKGGIICEIFVPLILVIIGLGLTKLEFAIDSPKIEMNREYINSSKIRLNYDTQSSITEEDLSTAFKDKGFEVDSQSKQSVEDFQDHIFANADKEDNFDIYVYPDTSSIPQLTVASSQIISAINFFGNSSLAPTINPSNLNFASSDTIFYSVMFNTTYPNAPIVASSVMNDSLLKQLTGDSSASIKTNLFPLKNTIGIKSIDNTADSINIAIMFSLAFAFIPTSIILFFIKERVTGAKYQQVISGMSLSAYWLANFIVDYIKYLIPATFMYCFIFILDVNFLREKSGEVVSFILFIFYGPNLILLAYVFSFAFKNSSKGQIFMFLFVYLGSFILSITTFVLRLVDSTRKSHDDVVVWFLRLLPFYDFTVSFINMGNTSLYKIFYDWDEEPKYLTTEIALVEIIFLIVTFVLMLLVLILIENWIYLSKSKKNNKNKKNDFSDAPLEVREDIKKRIKDGTFNLKETQKIKKNDDENNKQNGFKNQINVNDSQKNFNHQNEMEEFSNIENQNLQQESNELVSEQKKNFPEIANDSQTNEEKTIKMTNKTVEMENVYKVYKKQTGGKTIAVKGTFLDVFEGECFGLLGTNGAGKTTSFKMMCGEIAPTYGSVKVLGETMPQGLNKVRNFMGYCPQFDALLDKLTSEEHLNLFCALKGIDPKYHSTLVEQSLENLNLLKYRNVQAGTYSGGNKRKLNVSLALLGKPPIVFLDEPSSGMDPEARRFMWNIINSITNVQKKSSIVLTTHSMEEAEALTNRLIIMVEGRIEVLGNVQTIKNVYGDAFEIDLVFKKVDENVKLEIRKEIDNHFKDEEQLEIKEIKEFLKKKKELYQIFKDEGEKCVLLQIYKKYDFIEKNLLTNWIYSSERIINLKKRIEEVFPEYSILENLNLFMRLKLSTKYKLSSIFGFLQQNKNELNIEEYNVKQMSLEQIFLSFADQKKEDKS